ncbi:MAG: hypothetical protein JXB42_10365 [Deltaproteobacteria bacterium]|nr:hypothetical protein [Deltaproteobacteria bacterium]
MPVIIEKKNKKTGTVEEKTYETVAERLRRFREKYPISSGWQVTTELFYDAKTVRCEARIIDPDRRIVATGHAEEVRGNGLINTTSAVENCETSALGRALFTAGYGGGEFCSADELLSALKQQEDLKKAEMSLKKKQAPPDKKISAAGDTPLPAVKNDDQSRHGNTDDGLSGLPEGLPKLEGVRYKRENSHVVAEGSSVYRNRKDLKDAGFKFSQELRKWVYLVQ